MKKYKNCIVLSKVIRKLSLLNLANFNSCKNWKSINTEEKHLQKSRNFRVFMTVP